MNEITHPVGTIVVAKSAWDGIDPGNRMRIHRWCTVGCCVELVYTSGESKDVIKMMDAMRFNRMFEDLPAPAEFTMFHAGAILAFVGAASVASHKLKRRQLKSSCTAAPVPATTHACR